MTTIWRRICWKHTELISTESRHAVLMVMADNEFPGTDIQPSLRPKVSNVSRMRNQASPARSLVFSWWGLNGGILSCYTMYGSEIVLTFRRNVLLLSSGLVAQVSTVPICTLMIRSSGQSEVRREVTKQRGTQPKNRFWREALFLCFDACCWNAAMEFGVSGNVLQVATRP